MAPKKKKDNEELTNSVGSSTTNQNDSYSSKSAKSSTYASKLLPKLESNLHKKAVDSANTQANMQKTKTNYNNLVYDYGRMSDAEKKQYRESKAASAPKSEVPSLEKDYRLDTSYKMSKDEVKTTKQEVKDYFANNEMAKKIRHASTSSPNLARKMYESLSPEEQNEYDRMSALDNKASTVASFTSGAIEALPGYNQVAKKYDEAFEPTYGVQESFQNAKTQNKVANTLGTATSKIGQYAIANELLGGISAFDKAGKAITTTIPGLANSSGQIAASLLRGQAADTLLDTLPNLIGDIKDKKEADEILKNVAKNQAINLGFNVIGEGAGQLIGLGADALKNKKEVAKEFAELNKVEPLVDKNVVEEVTDAFSPTTRNAVKVENKNDALLRKAALEEVDPENVIYHSGTLSKLNKAETNGRFFGSNRDTGYYGTGHYFTDAKSRPELDLSGYKEKPLSSVDISNYKNLYRADTDAKAGSLHSFLKNLTRFTQGEEKYTTEELFEQFKNSFPDKEMTKAEFDSKLSSLSDYMRGSNLDDRGDSVSTIFMKDLGYGGVDTRGTHYANTEYGTVIYDLDEDSILQSNVTDAAKKSGAMNRKVREPGKNIWDTETDNSLAKKIEASDLERKVNDEFGKSYDRTKLDDLSKRVKQAKEKINAQEEADAHYRRLLEDEDYYNKEARKVARVFDEMGMPLSDEELDDFVRGSAKRYFDNVDEFGEPTERVSTDKLKEELQALEGEYNAEESNAFSIKNAIRKRLANEGKTTSDVPSLEANAPKIEADPGIDPSVPNLGNEVPEAPRLREGNTSKNIRNEKTLFESEIVQELQNNPLKYAPKTNAEADAVSDEILGKGTDYARNMYTQLLGEGNRIAVPLGRKLANAYAASGDIDSALAITKQLADKNTASGQFIQANVINMLKDNPVSVADYLTRELDKINKTGASKFKDWTDITLTDAEKSAFSQIQEGDTEALSQLCEQIGKRISKEYPVKTSSKIIEASHIAMLLNYPTMKRNVLANVFMLPLNKLAQKYTAVGQQALRLIDSDYKPDQALFISRSTKKEAAKAWEQVRDAFDENTSKYMNDELSQALGNNALKEGIAQRETFKLNPDGVIGSIKKGIGIDPNKNIIGGIADKLGENSSSLAKINAIPKKTLNALAKKVTGQDGMFDNLATDKSIMENVRQFTYDLLEVGDVPFVKSNFVDRLASYMSARGITKVEDIPEEAIEIAKSAALKATFKDDNNFTKVFGTIGNIPVLGEIAIPFKKTTANLAARTYDYSILNPMYVAAQEISSGLKNSDGTLKEEAARRLTQAIGEAAAGSTAVWLGIYLRKNRIITGMKSDDVNQAAFDEANGKKPLSISTKGLTDYINSKTGLDLDLGDKYLTWDWLQPSSTQLAIGSAIGDAIEKDEELDVLGLAKKVAITYGDGVLESDLFQNLQTLMGGGDFSKDSTTENFIEQLMDVPTRFVPSQVKGLAKAQDNVKRETYDPNSTAKSVVNTIISGVPYLRETLPKSYNIYGDEIKLSDGDGAKSFYANAMAAGKTGVDQSRPYSKNIQEIYDATNDENAFLRKAARSVNLSDGTSLKLNPEEYSNLSQTQGSIQDDIASAYFDNSVYSETKPGSSLNAMSTISKIAEGIAKEQTLGDRIKETSGIYELAQMYKTQGAKAVANYLATDTMIADGGVKATELTRNIYGADGKEGLVLYKNALNIASNLGKDSITEEDYKAFKKYGAAKFRDRIIASSKAKELDVSNSEGFREALNNGTEEEYAKVYKAITSVSDGKDEWGEPKSLKYNAKTVSIYKDRGTKGLQTYVSIKNSLPEEFNNTDLMNYLSKSTMSESDKAYFYINMKNGELASIPKLLDNDEDKYNYYIIKNKLDSNHNGSLDKSEKKNLIPVLESMNLSQSKISEITSGTYKLENGKTQKGWYGNAKK